MPCDCTKCDCKPAMLHEDPAWIPMEVRRPAEADADSNGDVLYLRSGVWDCRGRWYKVPDDAAKWMPLNDECPW